MEENINSCFSYERNKKTGQRPFDSNSILMQKKKKKKTCQRNAASSIAAAKKT
jgi:hypothetical protein